MLSFWHRMIKQIDRNGDGFVEWDEFLTYIREETPK